jgi:hypothetical protein
MAAKQGSNDLLALEEQEKSCPLVFQLCRAARQTESRANDALDVVTRSAPPLAAQGCQPSRQTELPARRTELRACDDLDVVARAAPPLARLAAQGCQPRPQHRLGAGRRQHVQIQLACGCTQRFNHPKCCGCRNQQADRHNHQKCRGCRRKQLAPRQPAQPSPAQPNQELIGKTSIQSSGPFSRAGGGASNKRQSWLPNDKKL